MDRRRNNFYMKKLLKKVRGVLVHCIGDHRECPKCGHSFIPKDKAAEEAWAVYDELRKDEI